MVMSKMKIKRKIKKVKSQIESISHWSVRCTAAVQSRMSQSQFKEINLGWDRSKFIKFKSTYSRQARVLPGPEEDLWGGSRRDGGC